MRGVACRDAIPLNPLTLCRTNPPRSCLLVPHFRDIITPQPSQWRAPYVPCRVVVRSIARRRLRGCTYGADRGVRFDLQIVNKPSFLEYKGRRFLIIDAPTDRNVQQYIKEFKKHNVTHLVRACAPSYDTAAVVTSGVEVHVRFGVCDSGSVSVVSCATLMLVFLPCLALRACRRWHSRMVIPRHSMCLTHGWTCVTACSRRKSPRLTASRRAPLPLLSTAWPDLAGTFLLRVPGSAGVGRSLTRCL